MTVVSGPALPEAAAGLDDAAVRERVARGDVNRVAAGPSRTVGEIVRANVLTRFNALLGSLFAVILVVGPPQDGLFGLILAINTAIGLFEELRAKRTLERLSVLEAPKTRVVRSGRVQDVAVPDVVLDDVVEVAAGDQVVVDGTVLTADGLEVDESLLTGESDAVPKRAGDRVMSGSFAVAGTGRFRATKVGDGTYAAQLATEARRFSLARSELRVGINRILRAITWVLVPLAVLLFVSQLQTSSSLSGAVRASVGGVVSMVPEGLVLLTSMTFAIAVTRLGRRRVLVQELAAVETFSRADVLCFEKTGTLTEGELELARAEPVEGRSDAAVREVLGALAAADPRPNASLRAVAAACPPPGWTPTARVAFSSARKWSAAAFDGHGGWLLGAPDVLVPDAGSPLRVRADALAAEGLRVLVLAEAGAPLDPPAATAPPLWPAALVVLRERLRGDAREILGYLAGQGVTVKVISGDHPRTVGAVAAQLGLARSDAVDARHLPTDPEQLADVVAANDLYGRVTPAQKRAMVAALRDRGHVVAMTGDGVNDVLALKDADLGVAMGSGSAATRGVAQVVLLDSAFGTLPQVLAEGRRIIANIERVAQLFLSKTVYAMLLALAVGVGRTPFPFLPRHLTLVAALTIGTPAFFLSLAPNAALARPGFTRRVLRFSAPAGVIAAAATYTAYELARQEPRVAVDEARTAATLTLVLVGLWVLSLLCRPMSRWRAGLLAAMTAGLVLVVAVPFGREFFALDVPRALVVLACVGVVALAGALLEVAGRLLLPRPDAGAGADA